MFEEKSERLNRVTKLFDLVVTVISFLVAYGIHEVLAIGEPADFLYHIAFLPFIVTTWIYFLATFGAYRSPRETSLFEYGWSVIRGVAVGVVLLLTLLFLLKIKQASRIIIVAFAVLDIFMLLGVRFGLMWYFHRSLQKGENFLKVLIIGTGNRAKHLAETLRQNSEWGVHIVGHLDPDPSRVGTYVFDSPVLGTAGDISLVLKDHVIDEVILAIPRAMIPNVDRIAYACEEEGVTLRFMADVFDVHVARMKLVELGSVPMLTLEPVAQEEWKVFVKRIIDLAMSLVILPLVLPVIGMIALAIKLDSPGPVFFIQERIGQRKRGFPMIKFRTMVKDAEKMMTEMEQLNEAEGPIFKIAKDPRVTRVGRLLRKTSLDELPQIFNIIRGEMSLVGPRPMSIRDVGLFDQGIQRKRFSVKPGLTCLWQASGRSQLPFSKWLELDLYYIDHWSISLDLKILFKTIPAVLKGTGAT
jgi:exopolysaccharide biosynthesis polyprenyl glycosylphosphotransferase